MSRTQSIARLIRLIVRVLRTVSAALEACAEGVSAAIKEWEAQGVETNKREETATPYGSGSRSRPGAESPRQSQGTGSQSQGGSSFGTGQVGTEAIQKAGAPEDGASRVVVQLKG